MKVWFVAVILLQLVALICVTNAPSQTLEYDYDRPGMNYRNFDLAEPQPELCRQACVQDSACKSFTYVKPGVQAKAARCWLKSGMPNPVMSVCCVSGTKAPFGQQPPPPAAPTPVESVTDAKFPEGTHWSVGAYESGIKKPPHPVAWVFHKDGVVEARGLWEGQWKQIPEGYLVNIKIFNPAFGSLGFDRFLVKFSENRKGFTAYRFENNVQGLRYRWGIRFTPVVQYGDPYHPQ